MVGHPLITTKLLLVPFTLATEAGAGRAAAPALTCRPYQRCIAVLWRCGARALTPQRLVVFIHPRSFRLGRALALSRVAGALALGFFGAHLDRARQESTARLDDFEVTYGVAGRGRVQNVQKGLGYGRASARTSTLCIFCYRYIS